MPRGRAQVSTVCKTLPVRSRIVSELLFSLETKTLPVALAAMGCDSAKASESSPLKSATSLMPQRANALAGPRTPLGRGCKDWAGRSRCAARVVKGCYSGLEADLERI